MTRCLAIFGLLLMCASVADAGLTQVLLQRQRAADLRLLGPTSSPPMDTRGTERSQRYLHRLAFTSPTWARVDF